MFSGNVSFYCFCYIEKALESTAKEQEQFWVPGSTSNTLLIGIIALSVFGLRKMLQKRTDENQAWSFLEIDADEDDHLIHL